MAVDGNDPKNQDYRAREDRRTQFDFVVFQGISGKARRAEEKQYEPEGNLNLSLSITASGAACLAMSSPSAVEKTIMPLGEI
jgi:hypothetical protein